MRITSASLMVTFPTVPRSSSPGGGATCGSKCRAKISPRFAISPLSSPTTVLNPGDPSFTPLSLARSTLSRGTGMSMSDSSADLDVF